MPANLTETRSHSIDVAIVGGGICGLTLALQLSQRVPGLSITVVEKNTHPVKEAAHKVGESTVEIQAHYLRDILGLEDHLNNDQLHKYGLRMFFSYNGNGDISKRVEYGQTVDAPLTTYQLDRGRFENELGRRLLEDADVDFMVGTKVIDIQLGAASDPHLLTIDDGERESTLTSRWIVDASGRASTLKRKLDLHKPSPHKANASWFRIEHPIDVETWSDDAAWLGLIPNGKRRLSTNHLMGEGYWVWIIPLASGSTSIGIVADPELHPFNKISTFEKTLNFLKSYEPQCAAEVIKHQHLLQDFRAMKDYAYSCQKVYSSDRWCLTGEAGVSIDPLYSSGGDLMAISNGLITDLIERDHRGEDVGVLAGIHDQVYLLISDMWLLIYQDQLPVMGNAQVMVAKVLWDTNIYWAVPGLLFFHDQFRRLLESPALLQGLIRVRELHGRVEQFFQEWAAIDNPSVSDHFADPYALFDFVRELHTGMAAGLSNEDLEKQFASNLALIEQLAGQLGVVVMDKLSESRDEAVISQLERWRADALLAELVDKYRGGNFEKPIDGTWITFGGPSTRVPA